MIIKNEDSKHFFYRYYDVFLHGNNYYKTSPYMLAIIAKRIIWSAK